MMLAQQTKTVHLYGSLAVGIGRKIELAFDTPAQCLRLLEVNFNGFLKRFERGEFYVFYKRAQDNIDRGIQEAGLGLGFSGDELHIMPKVLGAKKKGFLTALLGAVLIGAAFFFSGGTLATALPGLLGATGATFGTLASMGVGLVLQGIGMILTPTPTTDYSGGDEKQSFIFNGPVNVSDQGGPVPLVFGKMMVGTQVLSASLDAELVSGDITLHSASIASHLLEVGDTEDLDVSDFITVPEPTATLTKIDDVAVSAGTVTKGNVELTVAPASQDDVIIVEYKTEATDNSGVVEFALVFEYESVEYFATLTVELGSYAETPQENVGYVDNQSVAGSFD